MMIEKREGVSLKAYIHKLSDVDTSAVIGKGTRVWQFCCIMSDVVIGTNCNIGANVFIEKGTKIGSNVKIKNNVSIYEGVELEDGVFCGPSMVFTNDLTPRAEFPKGTQGHLRTIVRKGATIGANATIVCGHELGEYCMIGAGSVVTQDVKPYAMMYGNPAKQRGWVCKCGSKLNETLICGNCNREYYSEKKEGESYIFCK